MKTIGLFILGCWIAAATGCATLGADLEPVQTVLGKVGAGVTQFDEALAKLCPVTNPDPACEAARHGSETAHDSYQVALVALEAGNDINTLLLDAKGALEGAWSALRRLFGKSMPIKVTSKQAPVDASIPTPGAPQARRARLPLDSWEQMAGDFNLDGC